MSVGQVGKARRAIGLSVAFLISAQVVTGSPAAAVANPSEALQIRTLSNRADLLSGGDVLAEVVVPADAKPFDLEVTLEAGSVERDVTLAFERRDNGRILGVVTGLRDGTNTLRASLRGPSQGQLGRDRAVELTVTNHPIGGPVFSGPQVQPWPCSTAANGLGPAIDEQCNAPTRYLLVHKDAGSGEFKPYDPDNPPPDEQIATTTTDQGKTVRYIVRIETGTANRGIYDIAVLYDPSRPWEPWAPQAAWNGKLQWVFGCSAAPGFGQATYRACGVLYNTPPEQHVLLSGDPRAPNPDYALSRRFAVAASTRTNNGNNMNTVAHAETVMMIKEHIVETYGPIRYTIGQGGSGGSMSQYQIANQYPGLLDGIIPSLSFPDNWTLLATNSLDCALLNRYFDNTSPTLWQNVAQKDAVYGFGQGHPGQSGTEQCKSRLGRTNSLYRPETIWDPALGARPSFTDGPPPCVSAELVYDPESNPTGVRCSVQDYVVNIFGQRSRDAWGPVEQQIGRGFANRFLDRVGVQYGLRALQHGVITPEQFVDLNEKVGGWDIDSNWKPGRTEADPAAVERMYSTGQLTEGAQLANVPIIDFRPDRRADVHSNLQAEITRQRLLAVNGTDANRAAWIAPQGESWSSMAEPAFLAMDAWLAAIEADQSKMPLPQKIIRNRPDSAADGCFTDGHRVDDEVCSDYALDTDPLLVAGMPDTHDVLKCQLKPLRRGDYVVSFTDVQWARLLEVFPTGVCDWRKPGMGQDLSNVPWLSYTDGPGGEPIGQARR